VVEAFPERGQLRPTRPPRHRSWPPPVRSARRAIIAHPSPGAGLHPARMFLPPGHNGITGSLCRTKRPKRWRFGVKSVTTLLAIWDVTYTPAMYFTFSPPGSNGSLNYLGEGRGNDAPAPRKITVPSPKRALVRTDCQSCKAIAFLLCSIRRLLRGRHFPSAADTALNRVFREKPGNCPGPCL
jgi:hypothetical protein